LIYTTADADGQASQWFRALFMQEMLRGGVIGPSFIVSYSHGDGDIDRTITAFDATCEVYARALEDGVERFLVGGPTKNVYRRRN
jgi:glutamate-1-semialdehyde 2,1-aminomutase